MITILVYIVVIAFLVMAMVSLIFLLRFRKDDLREFREAYLKGHITINEYKELRERKWKDWR